MLNNTTSIPLPERLPLLEARVDFQSTPRTWYKYQGKTRNWYIAADEPNAGDYIVAGCLLGEAAGFGGRPLQLPGVDEPVLGWHSNSDDLFEDIGGVLDLREKHTTFVIVATTRENDTLHGIVHMDAEPVIGRIDRGEIIAESLARRVGRPLIYVIRATHGYSIEQTS